MAVTPTPTLLRRYQALEIVSWSEAIADAVDNALTNGNMSRWDVALCVTDREDSTAFHTNITLYPPVSAQQTVGGVRAYLPIIFELIGQGDVVSAMPVQSLQVPDFPTYTLFEIASPNGTAPPVRAEHAAAAVRANDDDRLPSVFVYGGWDGVGPMSDTWMFRPGDSPGTGAWEAVSPADGGGKWMYCRQDAHPVEVRMWQGVRPACAADTRGRRSCTATIVRTGPRRRPPRVMRTRG